MDAQGAKRGDRVAVVALTAVTLILFAHVLHPGWTFWYRDIYGYWSAQTASIVRTVADGSLPLWNPYISFGLPMLADPSYQLAYPMTWLNLVLDPAGYYKLYVLVHTFGAGLGLYRLLRCLRVGQAAAGLGAVAWIASGPFLVVVSHTHHFAGMAWIPWILLALDRALERPTPWAALALGAVSAGPILAGSADLCLMTGLLAAGSLGVRMTETGGAERLRRVAITLGLACVVMLGLSAIQWLPTLAILRSGMRLEQQDFGRLYWSLHPASLVDFLVPRLVAGLPLRAADRAALFESREPLFADHYLGAATVGLVLTGLLARRERRLRLLVAAGLLSAVLLSLGRHTPLYRALTLATPLALLRFPSKYLILAGFLWALLVGLGAEVWLRGPASRGPVRLGAGIASILAALALGSAAWMAGAPETLARHLEPAAATVALQFAAGRLVAAAGLLGASAALLWLGSRAGPPAAVARGALVALAISDLVASARRVNPPAPTDLLTMRPRVAALLPEGSRLHVQLPRSDQWLKAVRKPVGWESVWAEAMGRLEMVWPPTGARYGFRGSYDGDFTGLAPPLLSNLTLILSNAPGSPLSLRLLRLAGVDYVVTADDTPWPELQPVAEMPSALRGSVRLLRVPASLPNAYFVGHARWAVEPRSVQLLGDAGFDPEREVILAGTGEDRGDRTAVASKLSEQSRRADRLQIELECPRPGFVVVLHAFHPGWRVSVDGIPAELLRANVLFQGVAVPPGRHVVKFEYRPVSVAWGAAISALSAAMALSAGAMARLRRNRAGQRLIPVGGPL